MTTTYDIFAIGLINKTYTREELTINEQDEVLFSNSLVIKEVIHQAYILVNISLFLRYNIAGYFTT